MSHTKKKKKKGLPINFPSFFLKGILSAWVSSFGFLLLKKAVTVSFVFFSPVECVSFADIESNKGD